MGQTDDKPAEPVEVTTPQQVSSDSVTNVFCGRRSSLPLPRSSYTRSTPAPVQPPPLFHSLEVIVHQPQSTSSSESQCTDRNMLDHGGQVFVY